MVKLVRRYLWRATHATRLRGRCTDWSAQRGGFSADGVHWNDFVGFRNVFTMNGSSEEISTLVFCMHARTDNSRLVMNDTLNSITRELFPKDDNLG